uniref:Rieske domain-containing protein n=1 Tax=Globisporangium ultimum (strain ATCC 200006 / CBS 805.95 / DAOM BR144) TaxID=431595 RepID=K3WGZ5_GLOUD
MADTSAAAAEAQAALHELLSYEFVCKADEIPEGSRHCVLLPSSKRSVMLLHIKGQIYCMDQACYHHGGPLVNGDIEEMGGKVTVKCPWHAYHIAVETGEGLYMGMDMALDSKGRSQPSPPKVKSKGVKQRTHFVEIRNGEDVYVADSSLIPGSAIIMSDLYAFKPMKIPEKLQKGEVKIHSRFE